MNILIERVCACYIGLQVFTAFSFYFTLIIVVDNILHTALSPGIRHQVT